MPKKFSSSLKKKGKKESKEKTLVFQSPKGMHDILPQDQPWWEKVRSATKEIAEFYNFSRIDTPILESTEIFEKAIGESTDIVEKQMFSVKTHGKDKLVLRPENTAGIIRSYIQHGLSRTSQPLKVYYIGPFFRYEQPQAGRYRQFHQVGFEIIGAEADPIFDVQAIIASFRLAESLKIKNLVIQINSIGCKNCRGAYRRKLQDYYKSKQNKICKDCKRRLATNPLRLLDCKNEDCEEIKNKAPITVDYLCANCKSHFKSVLEYLDSLGMPYSLNPYLVRGLDYYNKTVFELFIEGLNIAIGGGGRYDYLGEMIGVKKTILPAIGVALGVERLIEAMKIGGVNGVSRPKARVFLIQMGDPAKKKAISLIEEFRKADLRIAESLGKDSLNSQLKLADKEGMDVALILGQREVFEDRIIIRDMKSGVQETVPIEKVIGEVKKRLR